MPVGSTGNFTIKNARVTITQLDSELLGGQAKGAAVGLPDAEYLGKHGAVLDFNNGTLYLRPNTKS